jgi:hypothetical protein
MGDRRYLAELLLKENVMNRSKAWLICGVVLSVFTSPLAHAQKAERPRGAEVASFFLNTTPIATGVVTRFLVNPFGEVDGLLLDNGPLVTFPPHMEHELTAAIKPGDPVAIRGQVTGSAQIKALVLTNTRTDQQVIEHPPARTERKMPKHLRAAGLQQIRARSTVAHVRYGKHGEVKDVVLADGTTVKLPKDIVESFVPVLRVGQELEVVGYGSENAYGRGIEATALGVAGQPLQPLFGPTAGQPR